MAEVEVVVGGKRVKLACEDGQEAHLIAMAQRLDGHAKRLTAATPQLGAPGAEAKLMLLAGLMLADEAHEAEKKAAAPAASGKSARQVEALAMAMLDQASAEIRDATERMNNLAAGKT